MAVCSLAFLFFCGVLVIVYHLAPGKLLRQVILACASVGFLIPLVPNLSSWEWFGAMLGGTYLTLVAVRARPRGAIVAIGIGLVLALFLYLKQYRLVADFIPFPNAWDIRLHPVEVVGLSYMTFKFIHMLIDQWQGQLVPFSLWRYLNYQLSFFTIVAGPIQRYNDFVRYWEEMDLQPSETRESLLLWIRILTGMIKVGLLSAYVQSTYPSPLHAAFNVRQALLTFYAYPVYLYLNFSGYTDIVIGAAGLLGFRLPENFNRPWLSRNVLDFWDRWHITLTHWIRDYIFMASYERSSLLELRPPVFRALRSRRVAWNYGRVRDVRGAERPRSGGNAGLRRRAACHAGTLGVAQLHEESACAALCDRGDAALCLLVPALFFQQRRSGVGHPPPHWQIARELACHDLGILVARSRGDDRGCRRTADRLVAV
jgi:D-alanyl-lipoteichoic acid acyltransferase DltB (MBOAT superfamily)